MTARKAKGPIVAGDRVRLTGRFLAFTGQRRGGEGANTWIVRECACGLCKLGGHVAVNEPIHEGTFTAEEIAAEPGLAWRHFARGNLARYGEPTMQDEIPVIGKLPIGA